MTIFDALGYLASGLVFVAFYMESMVALRIVAVGSNVAFIAYGFGLGLPPVVALHVALLPVNLWRLWQALHADADTGGAHDRDGPTGSVPDPDATERTVGPHAA